MCEQTRAWTCDYNKRAYSKYTSSAEKYSQHLFWGEITKYDPLSDEIKWRTILLHYFLLHCTRRRIVVQWFVWRELLRVSSFQWYLLLKWFLNPFFKMAISDASWRIKHYRRKKSYSQQKCVVTNKTYFSVLSCCRHFFIRLNMAVLHICT